MKQVTIEVSNIQENLDFIYENFVNNEVAKLVIEKRAVLSEIDLLNIKVREIQGKIDTFDENDPEMRRRFYNKNISTQQESRAFRDYIGVVPTERNGL